MYNLRGQPLVALDIETSGAEPGYHEIIQIGIAVLDPNTCEPVGTPFYVNIAPEFPDRADPMALSVNGLSIDRLVANGLRPEVAKEALVEWFERIPQRGHGQRLLPIAHNWGFERMFMTPWLGANLFGTIFDARSRDTMQMALYVNDRAAVRGLAEPFDRVTLQYLAGKFGIPYDKAHDALEDAVITAKVYFHLTRS